MAYPIVPAPYGYKPLNLIGGQVFSGSTRNVQIQYNYGTAIFFGDAIKEVNGFVTRASIASATTANQTTGVFLGCYYTSPSTKQRLWSQYYPGSILAGDITAIISDDPDIVIKAVMCTGTSVIGSAAQVMIGSNVGGITTVAGNTNTGDSANSILVPASLSTATLPFRVVDIVRDTAVNLGTAVYASISTATLTLTSSAAQALLVGTDVGSLDSAGQLIQSGSYVATAASAGATTVVLNAAPTTAFVAGSTLVFTQFPEVLVKFNFGYHGYYSATAV
jgi:hypothetical protein